MRKVRSYACALWGVFLVLALVAPAVATHEPAQPVPAAEGVNALFLGIDDEGTATAVWGDRFGSPMKYSTRSANGRFGAAVPVPGTDRVSESVFDEASNGNAIVAWIDTSADDPQIRASVKLGRKTGFRRHQIVHESTAVNVYDVQTATSESGRSAIVWTELASDGVIEIRGALSDGSDASDGFGGPVTIASGAGLRSPRIDMGAEGSALVVWDVWTQADAMVMASGAAAGQPFGAERIVEDLGQGPGNPEVAVNASNQAFVAYEDLTPEPCPVESCANFWVEMKLGSVTGSFTPSGGMPPNAESGYSFVSHDVELDDSGKAAILTSGGTPDGNYGVLARTSDTAGVFGPLQELSGENQVQGGPGIDDDELELAAGGGEFTAIWANDHDPDGLTNEVSTSSTSGGTFAGTDTVSTSTATHFVLASVDRNPAGDVVAASSSFVDELMFASPVNLGGTAALFGTDLADRLGGTGSSDVARLGSGNDRFAGKAGNDRIFGEGGKDFLDGGPGRNVLDGGAGRDTCVKRSRGDKLKSCEVVRRP